MSEFISNLPKGNVTLEADGTKLLIKSGTYQSTIHGMAPDEFPALPEINAQETLTIPVTVLKRAIQQTVFVASSDDTRPVLTGVFCHSHEGKLYFATTDGYRLAERLVGDTDREISAVIPAQTMQDVLRVITDDSNDVSMIFDENQVRILVDDVEITSRLIDGNFPDYRQLIPNATEVSVQINKDEFGRIIKVASLFARESGGSITLNAQQQNQKMSIHSIASQLGENTSEADAEVSADGQVTLNSRYLLEALGCIDSPKLLFSFSGKLAPCVLSTADKETERNYKHIIMPLKS